MRSLRPLVGALGIGLLAAAAAAAPDYLPGSRVVPQYARVRPPFHLSVVGPGVIDGGAYVAPNVTAPATATVIAAGNGGVDVADLHVVPAPAAARGLIAVATYDGGIVLHDPATFAILGTLATGGAPSDVAIARDGTIAAPDTSGTSITRVARDPWRVSRVDGVPLGNEILADDATGAFFVSDRDVGGSGALTRVAADGTVTRVVTGATAEGLALDATRGIVYVGNVNDGTVLAVDALSMKPIRRIPAVPRVFGIALSPDGGTLYAVANQSLGARMLAKAGYVGAISLGTTPALARRSAIIPFPLGIALDAADRRVFVTDEGADAIDVLDARTLRAVHAPLATCRTPWKPTFDAASGRLYVPCARADRVDVVDGRTLRRIAGAPFATGTYPLGVAVSRDR
jgi:DNA-binding beta-propeller fold protein YncE